jgi:anti-sigma B factor antagonist
VSGPLARVEARVDGGRALVRVAGEIDLSNADALEAELERHVASAQEVVVDLTEVQYLDSRGVWLLTRLARRLESRGTGLTLVAPPGTVAGEVLELTRMGEVVPVRESVSSP